MVSSPQESPSAGGIMTLYRADHLLFMTNKPAAVSLVKKEQKKLRSTISQNETLSKSFNYPQMSKSIFIRPTDHNRPILHLINVRHGTVPLKSLVMKIYLLFDIYVTQGTQ
jgi:hypothetical protein